jgi:hypothetical protein
LINQIVCTELFGQKESQDDYDEEEGEEEVSEEDKK